MTSKAITQTQEVSSHGSNTRWLVYMAYLAFGLAGAVLVFKSTKAAYLVTCGQPAQAVCFRIDRHTSSHKGYQKDSKQYYVRYRTADGEMAEGRIVPGFRKLSIGSKIDVLYSPHIPNLVEADNPVSLGIYPAITLFLIGFIIWSIRWKYDEIT